MKSIFAAAAAALVTFAATGCNTSSPGGTPGTKETFTVSGPSMSTTIKQGNKETVTLTLNRGADFKKNVALTVTGPEGVKGTFGKASVAASDDKDVKLTIDVAKDAAVGDHVLKVTATPESGTPTMVDVKVGVSKP